MTKTKMSTVAIVTLSVLLAAALAATIVLAAFTFTGKATTTLKFGNGITLEVSGVTKGAWNAHMISADGTISSAAATKLTDLSEGVALSKIGVQNTSDVDVVVAVGYKVEQTSTEKTATLYTSSTTAAGKTVLTNTNALATPSSKPSATGSITAGSEGAEWAAFKMGKNAASEETVINYIHSAWNSAELTAGSGFTGTVYIIAVLDDSNAYTNINAVITAGTYSEFTK